MPSDFSSTIQVWGTIRVCLSNPFLSIFLRTNMFSTLIDWMLWIMRILRRFEFSNSMQIIGVMALISILW